MTDSTTRFTINLGKYDDDIRKAIRDSSNGSRYVKEAIRNQIRIDNDEKGALKQQVSEILDELLSEKILSACMTLIGTANLVSGAFGQTALTGQPIAQTMPVRQEEHDTTGFLGSESSSVDIGARTPKYLEGAEADAVGDELLKNFGD